MNKEESYIFGLLLTDGYLTKQKGKVTGFGIELSIKDADLLEKIHQAIPFTSISYRDRTTNFSKEYHSCVLSYHRHDYPDKLIENGFPIENKSENACLPIGEYDEVAFWRGVIDGDGSLGLRTSGLPFISLTTKSDKLRDGFCDFMTKITGKRYNPKRNVRDNIYNLGCNSGSAKKVGQIFYENIELGDIYMERKYQKLLDVINWNK